MPRFAARFVVLSREQAQALTRAVHLLRPAWNEEGIFTALSRVAERDPFEVALAAFRAAADGGAQTPGVIPSPGPHWHELPPAERPKETYRPPHRGEDCLLHPGQFGDACSGCAADQRVGDTTAAADRRRPDGAAALRVARAELASAKAGLCGHGVPRNACLEHRAAAREPST